MRKYLYLIAAALLMIAGCKKEAVEVSLKVSPSSVTLSSEGGVKTVAVACNSAWATVSDADWFTVSPSSGKGDAELLITVSPNVKENESTEVRNATVNINAGDKTAKFIVSQTGIKKAFGGGEGTVSAPYLIRNADDLIELSASIAKGEFVTSHFIVTADIDMTGKTFMPIAKSSSRQFKGSFDGQNHTISKLTLRNTEEAASGLFGYLYEATVKNVVLADVDFDSEYVFTGGIAGHVRKSTVENCRVSGLVRAYKSGISVSADSVIPVTSGNAGYSGGICGYVENSTLRNCVFEGSATFYGKFSAGVAGFTFNSTVENCGVAKGCPVNVYYHFGGGVIGRAMGADNFVKGCFFEGNYTTVGYCAGGIVGQLIGGKVEDCVFGSYAVLGSDKYFVGGIAGSCQPQADIVISNCASYGTVKGAYSVAAIAGYSGQGSGASSDKDLILGAAKSVTIKNCAMVRGSVTATQGNSNGYPMASGIIGWSHTCGPLTVRGCYVRQGLIQTTYGANKGGVIAGVSSYQNNSSGAVYENCYCALGNNDFLVCGEQAIADPTRWFAGIHIRCTAKTAVNDCYTVEGVRVGFSSASATEDGCREYSVQDMTNGTMLSQLQAHSNGTAWVAGSDGYPTISGLPADPHVKPQSAKKVSVIGDSISTFRGWIPGGYSAHYPATDGTLTLVNETYWYRLIYDCMKNAEFEMNIAFSGSTVTNTTEANYTAKYGTATNAWWHNSYVERFAACGGCGRPDIILIHGGTNDWSHNADPLAPGVVIRNDSSNPYGGSAPSASVMNSIFTTADAAKTRTEVNALPDGTFCEAYAKLLCQIRERYPQCKVVCIIGDYLNQAIEQSILQIAEHYGAKTVNLFRVNGFNDLGGYSASSFTNKGTQPNMPKHDYSGEVSGCHPASKGMEFIANKIYSELGPWLEQ